MKLLLAPIIALLALTGAAHVTYQAPPVWTETTKTVQRAHPIIDSGTAAQKDPDDVRVMITPPTCFDPSCITIVHAHNARTNAGAAFVGQQISGSATTAVADYIALSPDTSAVGAGDTTCPSEIVTSGMTRKISTYAYVTPPSTLGGQATYTLSVSYSATGSYTINKLCLMTASSGGTLVFETLLGSTVAGGNGDIVNVTWTVNE